DAGPEDVAARRLDEERALADRKARLAADSDEARSLLADLRAMGAAELVEGRPLLALPPDVLPLVLADRAARRRLVALRELAAAGRADESRHRQGLCGTGAGANASFTTRSTFSRVPSSTGWRPPSSSRASSTRPSVRTVTKPKSERKSRGKIVLWTMKRS